MPSSTACARCWAIRPTRRASSRPCPGAATASLRLWTVRRRMRGLRIPRQRLFSGQRCLDADHAAWIAGWTAIALQPRARWSWRQRGCCAELLPTRSCRPESCRSRGWPAKRHGRHSLRTANRSPSPGRARSSTTPTSTSHWSAPAPSGVSPPIRPRTTRRAGRLTGDALPSSVGSGTPLVFMSFPRWVGPISR